MSIIAEAIKILDKLYSEAKYKEQCDLFKAQYNSNEYTNSELMWRHARALRELANNSKDKKEHDKLLYEGLSVAKNCLLIDENSSGCNKWYAFLLDLTGRIEGIKKRIENSYDVKKHLDIATVKSNGTDVGALHALGVWCYEITSLSWLNRKVAATFFATPPTSSYEESLKYLEAAEKISPGFYSQNYLYLGKVCEKMGRKVEAKEYLQKCVNYNSDDMDTVNAKKEARELLENILRI